MEGEVVFGETGGDDSGAFAGGTAGAEFDGALRGRGAGGDFRNAVVEDVDRTTERGAAVEECAGAAEDLDARGEEWLEGGVVIGADAGSVEGAEAVAEDAHAIAAASRLKFIAVAATGTDNIDMAACQERGIVVSNIRNYAVNTVPEHTFALIFALRPESLATEGLVAPADDAETPNPPSSTLSALTAHVAEMKK